MDLEKILKGLAFAVVTCACPVNCLIFYATLHIIPVIFSPILFCVSDCSNGQ